MLIAGVDEAGRGPCLGPMVLAIATIEKKEEDLLLKIGVKDSKLLAAKERVRQLSLLKGTLYEFKQSVPVDFVTWQFLLEVSNAVRSLMYTVVTDTNLRAIAHEISDPFAN